MDPIELIVETTPSLNRLKNSWARWRCKKKYLADLEGYDHFYALKEKKKMRITYQRHGCRILDQDNYIGGTKPLTDAIKDLGLIVDDSPEWCELIFLSQVKIQEKNMERTTVRIEECDGERAANRKAD